MNLSFFNFAELGRALRYRNNPMPRELFEYFGQINDRILSTNTKIDKTNLLFSKQHKLDKNKVAHAAKGYEVKILHLLSYGSALKLAKELHWPKEKIAQARRICPHASEGCAALCLSHGGQLALDVATNAQLQRNLNFFDFRQGFMVVLLLGIISARNHAWKKGLASAIRLNGTSDLSWEKIGVTISPEVAEYISKRRHYPIAPGHYPNLMSALPDVMFYDYTKDHNRILKTQPGGLMLPNYHLTLSLSERPMNRKVAFEVLRKKHGCVAIVTDAKSSIKGRRKGGAFPETITLVDGQHSVTAGVIDGDDMDLRIFDKDGQWICLRQKVTWGYKKALDHGFIVRVRGKKHPVIFANDPLRVEE